MLDYCRVGLHTNLRRAEEMQVLMRGRKGVRRLSLSWQISPSGCAAAANASLTLKFKDGLNSSWCVGLA